MFKDWGKGTEPPDWVTKEECQEMIDNAPEKRGRFGLKKKVVKKKATKKKVVKKKTTKKKIKTKKKEVKNPTAKES